MQNHPDLVLIIQVTFAPTHCFCTSLAKLPPIPWDHLFSCLPVLHGWSPVLPLAHPMCPSSLRWSTIRCTPWYRVRTLSFIISENLCVWHFTLLKPETTQATNKWTSVVKTGAGMRRRRPVGMPEYPCSQASGRWSSERGKRWDPRAALMTCIRSKHMLSPLLMPCHYYTTGSSNFCSHFIHCMTFSICWVWTIQKKIVSCSVMSNSVTLLMVTHQVSLSRELFRQEYWSGFPFPSPGDLPYPGIEPGSPALQADSLLTDSSSVGPFGRKDCINAIRHHDLHWGVLSYHPPQENTVQLIRYAMWWQSQLWPERQVHWSVAW